MEFLDQLFFVESGMICDCSTNNIMMHDHDLVSSHDDYLVGGLEHQFYFPICWVANHPN